MTVDPTTFSKEMIARFGHGTQVIKSIEELSELSRALSRSHNAIGSDEEVIDEIADCVIMLDQLAEIYGAKAVAERIQEKMQRCYDKYLKEGEPSDAGPVS